MSFVKLISIHITRFECNSYRDHWKWRIRGWDRSRLKLDRLRMQPNADTIKYVREKAQRRNCIIEFYSISTRPGLSACIFIERHLLSTLFMTVHFYEPINGRDIQLLFLLSTILCWNIGKLSLIHYPNTITSWSFIQINDSKSKANKNLKKLNYECYKAMNLMGANQLMQIYCAYSPRHINVASKSHNNFTPIKIHNGAVTWQKLLLHVGRLDSHGAQQSSV